MAIENAPLRLAARQDEQAHPPARVDAGLGAEVPDRADEADDRRDLFGDRLAMAGAPPASARPDFARPVSALAAPPPSSPAGASPPVPGLPAPAPPGPTIAVPSPSSPARAPPTVASPPGPEPPASERGRPDSRSG